MDKKETIYKCGKELFSSNGFKDTSVADITKMAGIAAGTFYLYYPSKENLFIEIFMQENLKLKETIHNQVNPDDDPMTVIMQITRLNLEGIAANPILREWYNKDVFQKIEQKFRETDQKANFDFMYEDYYAAIKKWQAEGKMRADIDCEMIMALFTAVINTDTHKEEIGIQYFPQLLEYLFQFVVDGLTNVSNQIKN